MEIPTHLSHKPIVKLEEYSQLDGRFKNKTDAEGLSIGLAQWNSQGNTDLSAKFGDTQVKNGLDNQKNCHYIAF